MRAPSHDPERPPISSDVLLERLGLDGSASDAEVEAAHEEVVGFLLRAPGSLRDWAEARLAEVDEAYAILRGPDRVVPALTADAPDLRHEALPVRAPAPGRRPAAGPPAPQPARTAGSGHRARASLLGDALGGEEWSEAVAEPAPQPARHRNGRRDAARPAVRAEAAPGPARGFGLAVPRALVAGVSLVAVVAVLVVGYNLGGGATLPGLTGTPDPGATGPVVDEAQVTAYMTRLAANAEDVEALQGLANLYFGVGDYATSGLWFEKLLAVDPSNISALLGSGAAAYNVGDLAAAEAAWTRAAALDPANVEVHYDLGFLYLAQEPPDYDLVREEWQKVIDLEPDSTLAKTIAGHLDSLAAGSSASPAPSSSSEASPDATEPPAPSPSPGT